MKWMNERLSANVEDQRRESFRPGRSFQLVTQEAQYGQPSLCGGVLLLEEQPGFFPRLLGGSSSSTSKLESALYPVFASLKQGEGWTYNLLQAYPLTSLYQRWSCTLERDVLDEQCAALETHEVYGQAQDMAQGAVEHACSRAEEVSIKFHIMYLEPPAHGANMAGHLDPEFVSLCDRIRSFGEMYKGWRILMIVAEPAGDKNMRNVYRILDRFCSLFELIFQPSVSLARYRAFGPFERPSFDARD